MQRVKLFLAFFLLCFLLPSSLWASQCLICHGAMKGRMESRKGFVVDVHVDGDKFASSVHGSLSCTDCHLGYKGAPHQGPQEGDVPKEVSELVPFTSLKAKIDPVALGACVMCHPDIYQQLRESIHGDAIFRKKEPDGPLCLDCHGIPHYIVPSSEPESKVNHANVLHTCGNCHEEKHIVEKYGLSPHVIEKYKESFHGKKYLLGHKKVPICNNCHGSHNITKVDAPNSPVSGEGKVNTCGKCHKGATKKFAAAPAHKYIGKENPIPYYGEKALIMLLLGTFAFIVSHVVLEAYSEIRDKVFRKEEKHD